MAPEAKDSEEPRRRGSRAKWPGERCKWEGGKVGRTCRKWWGEAEQGREVGRVGAGDRSMGRKKTN